MACFDGLPDELKCLVTTHLGLQDIAALTRTSKNIHAIADPDLYNLGKNVIDHKQPRHPLRWAASHGEIGTLKNALAAGIDVNTTFRDVVSSSEVISESSSARFISIRQSSGTLSARRADSEPRTLDDSQSGFLVRSSDCNEVQLGHPNLHIPFQNRVVREFQALHLAVRGGHKEAVRILLENGADIEALCDNLCDCELSRRGRNTAAWRMRRLKYSSVHLAICHHQCHVLQSLLENGGSACLHRVDPSDATTALHIAASTGQVGACRLLLDREYIREVDALDGQKLTPLYWAYFNGHWTTTVPFLLERGANIDFIIPHRYSHLGNCTMLHQSCAYGRYKDAIKLISLGADATKGSYRRGLKLEEPIHAATSDLHLFLGHQGSSRHPPFKTLQPLPGRDHRSALKSLIEMLIRAGADVNATTHRHKETPLHLAVKRGTPGPVAEALLAGGADINSRNHLGRTPLMESLTFKFNTRYVLDWPVLLLAHGAEVNATDRRHYTALHFACEPATRIPHHAASLTNLARLLLEAGARDDVETIIGKLPVELAFSYGNFETCKLLCRHRRERQAEPTLDNRLAHIFAFVEGLENAQQLQGHGYFRTTYKGI